MEPTEPGELRNRGRSQILEKVTKAEAERIDNDLQGLDSDVAFPALDLAYMRAVKAGFVREDILGPALLQPQSADRCPELLLNVLHFKQFRGTLLISILVITSDAREDATVMAACSNCGHIVPLQAKFCSHCGARQQFEQVQPGPQTGGNAKWSTGSKVLLGCSVLAGVIFAGLGIALILFSLKPNPEPPVVSPNPAKENAPVKKTAEPEDTSMIEATAIRYFKRRYSEVGGVEISIQREGKGVYIVHGYADLDLGQFGGTIRRDLVCKVEKTGGRWIASDVKASECPVGDASCKESAEEHALEKYLNQR